MPFGRKAIGRLLRAWYWPWTRKRIANFDVIYDTVFEPAIRATPLPEGGTLVPRRTDREFVAGDIGLDMFQYLEYSRFTVVDITGLNFNVAYELGHRHRARESGTAIFRQVDGAIPFDISHIKAFPYEYEPEAQIRASRALVTRVLTESLEQNRLDSPVRAALRAQRDQHTGASGLDELLRHAEEAIRHQDWGTAIQCYRRAVARDEENPLFPMSLGLLLKQQGQWTEAIVQFDAAIAASPAYAEAHREKGIAQNKLYTRTRNPNMPTGEEALRIAITLEPDDFDALASLGGILKRDGRYDEAMATYRRATEASFGHPYPLLNEIALQVRVDGAILLDARRRHQLERAERSLRAQITASPPYNAPWSFFDLAMIRFYLGDDDGLLEYLEAALPWCHAAWEPLTFRDSLRMLQAAVLEDRDLGHAVARLTEAAAALPEDG